MISNFTRNSSIIDIDKNIDISCQSSRNQSEKKKQKEELLFRRIIFIFPEIRSICRFSNDDCQGFYGILEGNENYQEKSGMRSDLMGGG